MKTYLSFNPTRLKHKLVGIVLLIVLSGHNKLYSQEILLDAITHPKFVNELPNPPVVNAMAGGTFNFSISEFYQDLGLRNSNGDTLLTPVWGYNGTYPGPTIVAKKDIPVEVFWLNNLTEANGDLLPHLLPVDTSLHWALSHHENWETMGIPVVTHLHGGHSESASDGLPEAWFTPGFMEKGPHFVKGDIDPYHYDNDQESATLWYHDHALGITRLNVYAGLAGFYLLRDDNELAMIASNQLPYGEYERGIVIQDRMFTEDGKLFYPSESEEEGAPEPSALPEFFGDFILVNGMAWPYMDVEPRPYRLRFLNGSDSRFYNLDFTGNLYFNQIGTDDGLLESPVTLNQMLIGPGERADVIVDFSHPSLWGKTIILKNNARVPFPNGERPENNTTDKIMAFRVINPFNNAVPASVLPSTLRPAITPLVQTGQTRQLLLFEATDEYGRLRPQLGTVNDGIMLWDDAITENPMVNDVETWEIFNTTEDAHPMHLHLVAFQIINRQRFTATQDETTAALSNISMIGIPKIPAAREKGWKDTAIMYPGEVTRIIAKFDREGLYVWHCHILSHEDHEMMRPYYVGIMPGSPRLAQNEHEFSVNQNQPNPFREYTNIYFKLSSGSEVNLKIFDISGNEILELANNVYEAGTHSVRVDGSNLAPGIYTYTLKTNSHSITRKMVVQ
jgi:spore coat protein A, manganese oxidase